MAALHLDHVWPAVAIQDPVVELSTGYVAVPLTFLVRHSHIVLRGLTSRPVEFLGCMGCPGRQLLPNPSLLQQSLFEQFLGVLYLLGSSLAAA